MRDTAVSYSALAASYSALPLSQAGLSRAILDDSLVWLPGSYVQVSLGGLKAGIE